MAQQGQYDGQKNEMEAAVGIHRIQCSAIPSKPNRNKLFTKSVPAYDIYRARPSVQWRYFHQKRDSTQQAATAR
jgi:hypothetical protein